MERQQRPHGLLATQVADKQLPANIEFSILSLFTFGQFDHSLHLISGIWSSPISNPLLLDDKCNQVNQVNLDLMIIMMSVVSKIM